VVAAVYEAVMDATQDHQRSAELVTVIVGRLLARQRAQPRDAPAARQASPLAGARLARDMQLFCTDATQVETTRRATRE